MVPDLDLQLYECSTLAIAAQSHHHDRLTRGIHGRGGSLVRSHDGGGEAADARAP